MSEAEVVSRKQYWADGDRPLVDEQPTDERLRETPRRTAVNATLRR